MIGESPMRPAIFHARPLVVVTPDISPFEFSARQLMVPVMGWMAISLAHASVFSSTFGNNSLSSAVAFPVSTSHDEDIGAAFHHLAQEIAPERASPGAIKPSVHFPEGIVCRIRMSDDHRDLRRACPLGFGLGRECAREGAKEGWFVHV